MLAVKRRPPISCALNGSENRPQISQGIVNSTREIVQTSTTAQNMIKNFQETVKIYEQSKKYYDALKSVNNLVKDARKVQQTIGKWKGVEFTDEQKRDYLEGKTIKLDGVPDKQGVPSTMYLKFSPEKGRPLTYANDPDKAVTQTPASESQTEIMGVGSTDHFLR